MARHDVWLQTRLSKLDNMNQDKEKALQTHIRNLLNDYALTHLTYDYARFTQDAVAELLADPLCEIPTNEPTSLLLPTDPLDDLKGLYKRDVFETFDERWKTDQEAIQRIKVLLSLPKSSRSETFWSKDDTFSYSESLYRLITPVLTSRSQRQTPNLGSNLFLKSLPKSRSGLLTAFKINPTEPVVVQEPKVDIEDTLKIKPTLDPQSLTFLKSISCLSRVGPNWVNPHVEAFFRRDVSPPQSSAIEAPEVPLFPRRRLPGSKNADALPDGFALIADLPILVPRVEQESEISDLYKEHMVIVNGWHAYQSSPSPTPSPTLSQERHQIDELFFLSSPNTEPAAQLFEDAKIDEVMIPRVNKAGSREERNMGEGDSVATFLSPLIPPKIASRGLEFERAVRSSTPQLSLSMLGKAPSVIGDHFELDSTLHGPVVGQFEDDNSDDLDMSLSRMYASLGGQHPNDPVLSEKLEDNGLLMEVPYLPEPNIHLPTNLNLPSSMHMLISPKLSRVDENQQSLPDGSGVIYLKKSKGLHSLNVELSWMPFKPDVVVPTLEELMDVANIVSEIEPKGDSSQNIDDAELSQMMKLAMIEDSEPGNYGDDVMTREDYNEAERAEEFTYSEGGGEMILTREDRLRLAGKVTHWPEDHNLGSDDGEMGASDNETHDIRPKRAKLQHERQHLDDSGIFFCPAAEYELMPCDHNLAYHDLGPNMFDNMEENFLDDHDKENVPPSSLIDSPNHYDAEELICDAVSQLQDLHGEPLDDLGRSTITFDNHYGGPVYHDRVQTDPLSFDSDQAFSDFVNPESFNYEQVSPNLIKDLSSPSVPLGDTTEPQLPLNVSRSQREANCSPKFAVELGVAEFAALRARKISAPHAPAVATAIDSSPASKEPESTTPPGLPKELIDDHTIILPSPRGLPSSLHRYMASLEVIQKQAFVRGLRLRQSAVGLVERENLGGVDLILDPYTAVLVLPLRTLPSQCESVLSNLCQQSWRYSRILVVFEAFPSSHAYKPERPESNALVPYPYSPPITKAVKKLRRDLSIAEGCGSKSGMTAVMFSFADHVEDAASIVRCFGNYVETLDTTQGAIWGDRDWFDDEPQEGEHDLAFVDGMNSFAACVILCQVSLEEFMNMSAEARVEKFGYFVGVDRIVAFNAYFDRRMKEMQLED